jgi:hypothetical protein
MGQYEKLLIKVISGTADANIPFAAMCQMLIRLGFMERTKGGHHIFARDGVAEIINLQPKGTKAKPYQVKQVRNIILKYRLGVIK